MKFDKAIQKIRLFKELHVNAKWSNFVKKKGSYGGPEKDRWVY